MAAGALAVLVAAAPVAQLIHTSYIVPQSLPVTLAVDVDLEPVRGSIDRASFSDLMGLDATIHVTNFGARNVAVLAAWFELWGYHVEGGPSAAKDLLEGSMARCGPRLNGRYGQEGPELTLIETGRILDGWSFEPDESADEKRLLLVRPSDFDYVKLVVSAMVAKGSSVKALADPSIELVTEPLAEDSTAYCIFDITGDLTQPALYQTAWSARDQSIIPFVGGDDAIAVQWRPAVVAYEAPDGSGPCDPDDAAALCDLKIQVGDYGPNGWAWPLLLDCNHAENRLDDCRVMAEISPNDLSPIMERYGLVQTMATVAYPLWAE